MDLKKNRPKNPHKKASHGFIHSHLGRQAIKSKKGKNTNQKGAFGKCKIKKEN